MKQGYERRLSVLSIGLAGVHGEGSDGSSITFYDTRLRPYYGELIENGFVIDKSPALEKKPSLALLAPMCKGSLSPGQRDAFQGADGSIVAHAISQDSNNPAAPIARLMLVAPDCGAFDYVAPDVYVAWWLKQGAWVGQRQGNTIVWSDGTVETIPPFSQRYQEDQQ